MSGWFLGIDFGTTYTVAAIAQDNAVAVIDIESNGNSRLQSAVFLTEDDETLVGAAAAHQAVFFPERYEPTPKRAIGEGEIFLGDRLVPVSDLVAAVLRRAYAEACRQQGESMPEGVAVTHPADWSAARLDVLRDALLQAGVPSATLVPEPVAAAARIAAKTPVGGRIAVYDFGGGTFDAAVLTRTSAGFMVAGPPAGRDPLGGEDIDRRIITYLGTVIGETDEAWLAVTNPATAETRRQASELREEVQRAKETLSEVSACQLWVPGVGRGLQLTRSELDELIAPDVEATVDTLEKALADADVAAADLDGLYLVGGSSRIPLVADAIWRRLKMRPQVQDNPKSVVALGAVAWLTQVGDDRSEVTVPLSVPSQGGGTAVLPVASSGAPIFRAHLAADISGTPWAPGSSAVFQLVVDRPGAAPATLRVRDEPVAVNEPSQLAEQVRGFRATRTPGFRDLGLAAAPGVPGGLERRFSMHAAQGEIAMLERYLIVDGRALVLAGPESMRDLMDAIVFGPPPPPEAFTLRLEFPIGPDWTIAEQVVVRRNGTALSFIAERRTTPSAVESSAWMTQQLDRLLGQLDMSSVAARGSAVVLAGLSGEISTLRWRSRRGAPMLTKLGVAAAGNDVYTVTISLPHQEQNLFSSLARQVRAASPSLAAPP
jgi:actin-like ATPase involved in cell morphogenesis